MAIRTPVAARENSPNCDVDDDYTGGFGWTHRPSSSCPQSRLTTGPGLGEFAEFVASTGTKVNERVKRLWPGLEPESVCQEP